MEVILLWKQFEQFYIKFMNKKMQEICIKLTLKAEQVATHVHFTLHRWVVCSSAQTGDIL